MENIDYKKLLVIWLALGILIGGYLVINPIKKQRISPMYDPKSDFFDKYITYNGNEGEIILLITFSGALIIGGLGYLNSKNNRDLLSNNKNQQLKANVEIPENSIRNHLLEAIDPFMTSNEVSIIQETNDFIELYWDFEEVQQKTENNLSFRRVPNQNITVEWTQKGIVGVIEYKGIFDINEEPKKIKVILNKNINEKRKKAVKAHMDELMNKFYNT